MRLISHKWQIVGDALDLGSLSWCGMSLDNSNHTGMETSLHHAIACQCDSWAQRVEKQQVGSYICVHVCVQDTQRESKQTWFSLYQDEFVWSGSSETGILIDALIWSSQWLKHVWREFLEKNRQHGLSLGSCWEISCVSAKTKQSGRSRVKVQEIQMRLVLLQHSLHPCS